jgi:hypothetical protein
MFKRTAPLVVPILLVAFAAATPPLRAQQADKDAEAIKRLQAEAKELAKAIKEREQLIFKLQDEVTKLRAEALALEQPARALRERNQELLRQIEVLTARLAGKQGDPAKSDRANPPANLVKGKILKVDPKEGNLVQISLGTDDGLQKGHTLEVFRLTPQPKYLGMVRIVDVSTDRSVGRMIAPAGGKAPEVQEGDQAWSRLIPPEKDERNKFARAQARVLTDACRAYAIKHKGQYPENLKRLTMRDADTNSGPWLENADDLLDPWGKQYQYDPVGPKNGGRGPDIWTVAPDKTVIGNWPVAK